MKSTRTDRHVRDLLKGVYDPDVGDFTSRDKHLVWVKRRRKGKSISYLIGKSLTDLEKEPPQFIGKLKASVRPAHRTHYANIRLAPPISCGG